MVGPMYFEQVDNAFYAVKLPQKLLSDLLVIERFHSAFQDDYTGRVCPHNIPAERMRAVFEGVIDA